MFDFRTKGLVGETAYAPLPMCLLAIPDHDLLLAGTKRDNVFVFDVRRMETRLRVLGPDRKYSVGNVFDLARVDDHIVGSVCQNSVKLYHLMSGEILEEVRDKSVGQRDFFAVDLVRPGLGGWEDEREEGAQEERLPYVWRNLGRSPGAIFIVLREKKLLSARCLLFPVPIHPSSGSDSPRDGLDEFAALVAELDS